VALTDDVDVRGVWVAGVPALVGSDTAC